MENKHVLVCSADVAAFVDALETIGYPAPETDSTDMAITAAEEISPTTFSLENSDILPTEPTKSSKRFRANPKQQKEVMEKLFEKQKAVVTKKSFMNIKGNKRFKSDVWSWFGDIKLLISRSEAKLLKIPYYVRYCGEEQMMLSKSMVGCFKCSALFVHDTQKSGTSTLRAHMKVCSRPRSKRKRGSPTVIFFPKIFDKEKVPKEVTETEKNSAQEHLLNFLLSTNNDFNLVNENELGKLLQMCISIGSTYGDVNVESMLCQQEKLSDFLLNDLYISSVNSFYSEFQHTYGAAYNVNIWIEQNQKPSYISLICYYSNTFGELKSVFLHTDEFDYLSKSSEDVKDWYVSFVASLPVIPLKTLIITDNTSNLVSTFKDEQCIRCAAQNMNSTLQEVVSKALQANQNGFYEFSNLINGCTDLAAYFEKVTFQQALSEPLKVIKDDNWVEVLTLLKSVNNQYDEILNILNETSETHLLSVEKSDLTNVIDFFHLFEKSLQELSSCSEPMLNIVIPWIIKLKKHCFKSKEDTSIIAFLKNSCFVELNEHLVKNISVYHRIATLLDPRFKRLVFLPREDHIAANVKIKCLVKECMEAPDVENFPFDKLSLNQSSCKAKISDTHVSSTNNSTNFEKSAHREVDNYLSEVFQLTNQNLCDQEKFNPVRYWVQNSDRFPNLSKIAMWVLSCPASCSQSGDVFMEKNWFVNCCRVHQNSEHISKTLFVKSFKKL